MYIGGLERCSLIDFPGNIAAVVFTQGCNFRCGYCHNPELVYPSLFKPSFPEEEVFGFLESRKGKLDGLVITGGEPTMHEDLPDFMGKVKDMGFKVKLDSNGTNPDMLEKIINAGLADYIAMDIKGPMHAYENVVCAAIVPENIERSIKLIMGAKDYEFRTTIVKSQLPKDYFPGIGELIRGAKLYALQKFLPPPSMQINNLSFLKEKSYSDEELQEIKAVMKDYVKECIIR